MTSLDITNKDNRTAARRVNVCALSHAWVGVGVSKTWHAYCRCLEHYHYLLWRKSLFLKINKSILHQKKHFFKIFHEKFIKVKQNENLNSCKVKQNEFMHKSKLLFSIQWRWMKPGVFMLLKQQTITLKILLE